MLSLPEDFSYRLDLYTLFSFVGVVQGLFLAFFFLTKQQSDYRYLGGLILAMALVTLEISLCYSGLIVHVLHFVDATEPFNLVYAPLLYLFVLSFNKDYIKYWYLHFIPFLIYLLYSGFFFFQSTAFKYNAFRYSYHPDWAELPNEQAFHADPFGIKEIINEISLTHFLIYLPFIVVLLYRFFQTQKRFNFIKIIQSKRYGWRIGLLVLMFISYALWAYKIIFVFRDLEDNLGAILNTFIIYFVNFFVVKNGLLTEQKIAKVKYEKSSLSTPLKKKLLVKLEAEMANKQPYKNPQFSLQILAQQVHATPHHVSQVLNEQLQLSFYEWLAIYRVNEAKRLLQSPDYQVYKLEEIGRQAGFNSRSAFYKAFKKLEHTTPAAYRRQD